MRFNSVFKGLKKTPCPAG